MAWSKRRRGLRKSLMSRRPGPATVRTTVVLSRETWSHLDHVSRESRRTLSEVVEWYVLRGMETGVPLPPDALALYRDEVLSHR